MKTLEKILKLSSLLLMSASLPHCSDEGSGAQANLPVAMMPMTPMTETQPDPIVYSAPTLSSVMPTSVPNNVLSPLTLTGANFRSPAAVTIGGVDCTSVTVVSPTQITCMYPGRAATCGGQSISVTHLDDQKSGDLPLPQGLRLTSGSFGFGDAATTVVENGPASIVVGDFDGDQILDLATANRMRNSVSLARGTGGGGFADAVPFPVDTHPTALVVADLNGDQKLDIASANDGANSVSVLLGDGQGGFASAANFPVGMAATAIANGDFNADGKLDLVTGNFTSRDVSLLLGDGQGARTHGRQRRWPRRESARCAAPRARTRRCRAD